MTLRMPAHLVRAAIAIGAAVPWPLRADPLLFRGAFTAPSTHVQRDGAFATALARAGRLNADGRDELLIGQPGRTVGASVEAGLGWVRSAGWGPELLQIQLAAPTARARLGSAVAGGGDINLDGLPDLLVGAPGANRVVLVYGRAFAPGSLTYGDRLLSVVWATGADEYGAALTVGGDINGDSLADYAIGAPGSQPFPGQAQAGRVEVRLGFRDADRNGIPDSGLEQTVTLQEPITAANARFGHRVSIPGDMDGDGLSELAVAVPNPGGATGGELYVFRGTTFPAGMSGLYYWVVNPQPLAGSRFAESLAAAGDVDGDGLRDLVVGDPGLGRAHVYRGRAGGFNYAGTQLTAPYAGGAGGFGMAVAGVGDVDGDGYDEVAVGDPTAGIVTIFFGSATGTQAAGAYQLAGGGDLGFGRSIAGGDWDGIGRDGVVVGAPESSIGGAVPAAGRYHAWGPIASFDVTIALAGAVPELAWPAESGVRYRLWEAPAPGGSWTLRGEYTVAPGATTIRVSLGEAEARRFFRVDAR